MFKLFYSLISLCIVQHIWCATPVHAQNANDECKKLSQLNLNSKILCKGNLWFEGKQIPYQAQVATLPQANLSNAKVVKSGSGYYKFIRYERVKDINGKEFTIEKPGEIVGKTSLLSRKHELEQLIIEENKKSSTISFAGNVTVQQMADTQVDIAKEREGTLARWEKQLAELNNELARIDEVDKLEAQKSGVKPSSSIKLTIPSFDVKKLPIPSNYFDPNGNLWPANRNTKPEYEFTFYKSIKDINGVEHKVVSKQSRYTKKELEDKKQNLVAINDPYNPDPISEGNLVLLNAMLKKIDDLEY